MVDHVMGQLLDRHVGAERAGPGPHDPLDRLVLAPPELLRPQQAKDDPLVVHDHAGIPAGGPDSLPNLADRLVKQTRRGISPGDLTGPRPAGVPTLGRQASGQPVQLTGHVVVDLGEPKALEPPRGSWTEVSGRVPAVHDDGPARVERPPGLGLDLAEGRLIAPGRWSSWNSSVGSTSTSWTPCFIRSWTSWRLTSRTLHTPVRPDQGSTVEWRSPNHEVPLHASAHRRAPRRAVAAGPVRPPTAPPGRGPDPGNGLGHPQLHAVQLAAVAAGPLLGIGAARRRSSACPARPG